MPSVTLLPLRELGDAAIDDRGDRLAENGETRGDGAVGAVWVRHRRASPASRFICGVPMKLATNRLAGLENKLVRRGDLLDLALLHDRDAVGHGQRLDLVVRDDDRRLVEFGEYFLDLGAHRLAQLDVETAQRFVEQKAGGVAHDRAADRDALLFALSQLMRTALENRFEVERFADARDARRDLGLAQIFRVQGIGEVVLDREAGIERVELERHRDVAFARRQVVDPLAGDHDVARGRPFQPCDHPQHRGLAAAGGTEQAHHLAGGRRRGPPCRRRRGRCRSASSAFSSLMSNIPASVTS